jgi:hypothetical protein
VGRWREQLAELAAMGLGGAGDGNGAEGMASEANLTALLEVYEGSVPGVVESLFG